MVAARDLIGSERGFGCACGFGCVFGCGCVEDGSGCELARGASASHKAGSYPGRKAILEKGVQMPPGAEIGYDLERDRKRFHVSEGGVAVVPGDAKIEAP